MSPEQPSLERPVRPLRLEVPAGPFHPVRPLHSERLPERDAFFVRQRYDFSDRGNQSGDWRQGDRFD
jgi:hypothetical protein